jgi:hypothetical protein
VKARAEISCQEKSPKGRPTNTEIGARHRYEWGITTHLRDMTPTEISAEADKLFENTAE